MKCEKCRVFEKMDDKIIKIMSRDINGSAIINEMTQMNWCFLCLNAHWVDKRQVPSFKGDLIKRNIAIFIKWKSGKSMRQAAKEYKLSVTRVSQIIYKMRMRLLMMYHGYGNHDAAIHPYSFHGHYY